MSPALFILSITFYLVSMVAGLIGAFFVRQISSKLINILVILHFLILISWLVLRNDSDSISNPGTSNYLFLAFFCSGVFTAGMLLRSQYPVVMKIYYSAFLLSLVVFVISPSRVLGFVASGDIHSISPSRFHIRENYYFVEQQAGPGAITDSSGSKYYKVVREMGMFHKTLSRDVLLPSGTESVSLLDTNVNDYIQARVFFLNKGIHDSLDLKIPVGNHRDDSNDIKQIRN